MLCCEDNVWRSNMSNLWVNVYCMQYSDFVENLFASQLGVNQNVNGIYFKGFVFNVYHGDEGNELNLLHIFLSFFDLFDSFRNFE